MVVVFVSRRSDPDVGMGPSATDSDPGRPGRGRGRGPLNGAPSATTDNAAMSRSPQSGEPTHLFEKINSCPPVAWALPSPVGSMTWPSTAIGLFQWPAGTASVVISLPLAGR